MNNHKHIDKVIPEIESNPKRIYEQDGRTITCYQVQTADISRTEPIITPKPEPLFIITLGNEEQAKALMNDLYYGEYTGA